MPNGPPSVPGPDDITPQVASIGDAPRFTRSEVRELVRKEDEERTAVMEAGGNVHQFHLDLQDRREAIIRDWPVDEQDRFLLMVAEETNALAAAYEDQTARILFDAQVEQDARVKRGAFVLLVALLFVVGTWLGFF